MNFRYLALLACCQAFSFSAMAEEPVADGFFNEAGEGDTEWVDYDALEEQLGAFDLDSEVQSFIPDEPYYGAEVLGRVVVRETDLTRENTTSNTLLNVGDYLKQKSFGDIIASSPEQCVIGAISSAFAYQGQSFDANRLLEVGGPEGKLYEYQYLYESADADEGRLYGWLKLGKFREIEVRHEDSVKKAYLCAFLEPSAPAATLVNEFGFSGFKNKTPVDRSVVNYGHSPLWARSLEKATSQLLGRNGYLTAEACVFHEALRHLKSAVRKAQETQSHVVDPLKSDPLNALRNLADPIKADTLGLNIKVLKSLEKRPLEYTFVYRSGSESVTGWFRLASIDGYLVKREVKGKNETLGHVYACRTESDLFETNAILRNRYQEVIWKR